MYGLAKRALDVVLSMAAVLVAGPFLLVIAAVIKLDSLGPVFYRGERAGLGGRVFRIFKFRSMVSDAEKKGGTPLPLAILD